MIISAKQEPIMIYVALESEEWSGTKENRVCGLEILANIFAKDFGHVCGQEGVVITKEEQLRGDVIIVGTVGHNRIIDMLISEGTLENCTAYDSYRMTFIEGETLEKFGILQVKEALIIAGANKRGAIYGMFHVSEKIGVSPWIYMADAWPQHKDILCLDRESLGFGDANSYISKEPSVKYRGIFINDESPSFTSWAKNHFDGLNEDCYCHIFELLLRLRANYLWPAMWDNVFSEEGKEYPLANAVLADAYGICMGTSHHEGCHRAGLEWQQKYKQYGEDNAWDYSKNRNEILNFWKDGLARNGHFETTITLGMRGESDSKLSGGVQENIDLLKLILSDQLKAIQEYKQKNPGTKTDSAPLLYIPYSENEEYYYGPDDGSIAGLNEWERMEEVTIMLTDDNYGNLRSIPTKEEQLRKAGFGLYYHLDGHIGTGAYEWVSSTQLEHIWDQLTIAYENHVRDIWVINVGDVKPLELELSYALSLAYDMEKWGRQNTAEPFRIKWIQEQFGGEEKCSKDQAKKLSHLISDFLKISTFRKPEYVSSTMYSLENEGEAERVLYLCESVIHRAEKYKSWFENTPWEDAYEQIVYYQAVGTANVTRMQILKGYYDYFISKDLGVSDYYGKEVLRCIQKDQELTTHYNQVMSKGKWNGMMLSPHVGFKTWNSEGWSYPQVELFPEVETAILPKKIEQNRQAQVTVLEGKDFTANIPAENGTTWCEIEGYGRYQSVMRMMPSTNSFTIPSGKIRTVEHKGYSRKETVYLFDEKAPYLEYEFQVEQTGEYMITLLTTPTNHIFKPKGWGYVPVELCYAISIDGKEAQIVNSLPKGKYISYAADGDNRWRKGIMDNIHRSESKHTIESGNHFLRIYGMHAGLGIERVIICKDELLPSYLGPEKR